MYIYIYNLNMNELEIRGWYQKQRIKQQQLDFLPRYYHVITVLAKS